MKKMILTAAGVILFTSAGIGYVVNAKATPYAYDTPIIEHMPVENEVAGVYSFEEYETLAEVVHFDELNTTVVEDDENKRVILLKNDAGHPEYKSIYMKHSEQLKVVDFNEGLIFNGKIGQLADGNDMENADIEKLPEFSTLMNQIDVANFKMRIVEENRGKRVILFMNENDQPQYKSIYIKEQQRLKMIDFKGGLVFDGKLIEEKKNEVVEAPEAPKQEVPKVEDTPKVEVPKQEAPKVETPKQEVPKVEAPKQETPKAETPKQEAPKVEAPKNSISGLAEYGVMASKIDMGSYSAQVVEENRGKRIVLLNDGNGKPRYKSIYIKNKSHLKIIDMRGGLLYNGNI